MGMKSNGHLGKFTKRGLNVKKSVRSWNSPSMKCADTCKSLKRKHLKLSYCGNVFSKRSKEQRFSISKKLRTYIGTKSLMPTI
mgnify:CR=1 FL=1